MKKILSLLLAMILVFSMMLLASCGLGDVGSDDDEDDDDDDVGGGTVFDISKEEAERNMKALEVGDGYEITFHLTQYDTTENYLLGRKGNVIWSLHGEDELTNGSALKFDGDTASSYSTYDGTNWDFQVQLYGESATKMAEITASTMNLYLFIGSTLGDFVKKSGEGKVAGRSCTNYSYRLDAYGSFVSYEVSIDKELGVTLLYKYETGAAGETVTTSFEVTKLLTGDDVVAPTLEGGGSVLDYSGLTRDDLKAGIAESVELTQIADLCTANVTCSDSSDETFGNWVNALADICKGISLDEAIYADEYCEEAIDSVTPVLYGDILSAQFFYQANYKTVTVTLSNYGKTEDSFCCTISID